jgi:hypothetical protein
VKQFICFVFTLLGASAHSRTFPSIRVQEGSRIIPINAKLAQTTLNYVALMTSLRKLPIDSLKMAPKCANERRVVIEWFELNKKIRTLCLSIPRDRHLYAALSRQIK